MTLGTNATIHERLEYAPHELNHQEVIDALHELEEWQGLDDELNISSPAEVKKLCDELDEASGYKSQLDEWLDLKKIDIDYPSDVEALHVTARERLDTISELEDEIGRLNEIIAGLEEDNFNLRTTIQTVG